MIMLAYALWLTLNIFALRGSAEVHLTPCPDTWTAYRGSCYLFVVGRAMSFFNAEHYCRQHGGHLVHVDSAEENAFLKDHIRNGKGEGYWIGLTDESVEGLWEWYDTHTRPNFTDWGPGQPNDYHHNEDCAHFYPGFDYSWDDYSCELAKQEPLCEISEREPGIIG